jgi:hypothetical protein
MRATLFRSLVAGPEGMSKMKFILSALSILTLATGLAIVCVGAFFLKRLDDHAFGDPAVFYGAAHHYGSITSTGSIVCLIGCIGLALALDHTKGFHAAKNSALIAFATAIFGLFFFPIHNASGAVYSDLLFVTFGASLIFVLVASARWISSKTRSAR